MQTGKDTVKAAMAGNMERGDAARKKLIEAGLKIYSEVGFEAATTRALAAEAGVNIAAIPYYFESKEGLYIAVIDYITDLFRTGIEGQINEIKQALRKDSITPEECRALLDNYMRHLIHFMLQENKERAYISHIYIREQLDPTAAFERMYKGFLREAWGTLADLIGHIVGPNFSPAETRLIAQTLIGQISVFKSSRAAVLHNMNWEKYGEKGIAEIERIVMGNVDAVMTMYQTKGRV